MRKIDSLRVEKLSLGGAGLGFHEGKAIFVPYTIPGDVVEVSITHERKDHAFGKVLSYHEHSQDYCEPGCQAFGGDKACGGCDWLMLPYAKQVEYKAKLISELFGSFLDKEIIYPTVGSPKPTHYRNKVFMPVSSDPKTGKLCYGIYARWTHQIVPHQACQNHPPLFDHLADRIIELCAKAGVTAYDEKKQQGTLRHIGLRCNNDQSEVLVVLVTHSAKLPFSGLLVKQLSSEFPMIKGIIQNINRAPGNVILGNETKLLFGREYLQDTLSELSFQVGYSSFWQINSGTMELILDSIRSAIKRDSVVLDAFCGIGAIGLAMASRVKELILLEEQEEAIADAKINAELNGSKNLSFVTGTFADTLPDVLATHAPQIIIMDPPRSGIDPASLETIRQSGIKKVIYLSCSPITLARDLKLLMAEGCYTCLSLQSFDMFPNTWHIECLAILEKKKQ